MHPEGSPGSPPGTLLAWAPAKVNLYLRIEGRRADGYHELDTLIVPLDLADRLEIHAASDPSQFRTLSLSLQVEGEPGLTRGVPVDESNLVLRAAKALADRTGARGFAEIRLEKRVPPAAGLGGGSSDAAAALRALDALWGSGLGADELREVAAGVGSDVPALVDPRPVRARGRGERLEPAAVPPFRVALVMFPFGVRTADAYGWWDANDRPTRAPGADPGGVLWQAGDFGWRVQNDLEEPVMRRHPEVRAAKEALLAAGCLAAVMCGSGPTVAGILSQGRKRLAADTEARLADIAGSRPGYASALDRRGS